MKRKKLYKIMTAFVAMIFVSGSVMAAQIVSEVEDTSVALRVKNGYTTTLTIVVTGAGTNFAVTAGAHANTIDGNVSNTIALLNTGLLGVTNAAGTASLTINTEPSLLADSVDGELLDGTYTATAGKWLELLWDTSAHLSYDLSLLSQTYQAGVASYILKSIQGLPGGTGNMTVSIYKKKVLIAQKVIVSPVYIPGATGSNPVYAADAVVNLDWILNMPFSGADAVIIRATRATTATTGVLSAIIE